MSAVDIIIMLAPFDFLHVAFGILLILGFNNRLFRVHMPVYHLVRCAFMLQSEEFLCK